MLLIYADESIVPALGPDGFQKVMEGYAAWSGEAHAAGVIVQEAQLEPASRAKSIQLRNGARLQTDGPFAETKEQLGGYVILECADHDEAIEWAARIPFVADCTFEVRPIMEPPPAS